MEGIGILVWLIGIAVEVLSIVFSEKTEPCRHKKGYMIACAIFNGLGLLVCVLGIINDMPKDIMLVTYGTIIIWGCYWFGYAIQRLAYRKGYTISLGWGFWFWVFALLYWGFMPIEPNFQANIIAHGIKKAESSEEALYTEGSSVASTAAAESIIRHCKYCGAELKPNAAFCSKCGTTVK